MYRLVERVQVAAWEGKMMALSLMEVPGRYLTERLVAVSGRRQL
jgi:hypothetical protein